MTHISDLPNDILKDILRSLNAVERRRFSKTCHRFFNYIRDQKQFNWIESVFAIDVHAHAKDVYVICVTGLLNSVTNLICPPNQLTDSLIRDAEDCSIIVRRPVKAYCHQDVTRLTIALLEGAAECFATETQSYKCPEELFDVRIAKLTGQAKVRRHVVFEIGIEHLTTNLTHIYQQILLIFINFKKAHGSDVHTHFILLSGEFGKWRDEPFNVVMKRKREVKKWKTATVDRLEAVCKEHEIPKHFINDQRRVDQISSDFFLKRFPTGDPLTQYLSLFSFYEPPDRARILSPPFADLSNQ